MKPKPILLVKFKSSIVTYDVLLILNHIENLEYKVKMLSI